MVGLRPTPYNSSVARLPGALFSVAVEGLRLRRCTLCSPFSGAALAAPPLPGRGAAPHSQSVDLLISQFLCVLCGSSVPLWVPRSVQPHRRQRRQPGLQPLWLLQASKPLNFQASLERSSCPSCFPQNIPRFPIDFTGRACRAFCSLWPWKVCGFAAARSVFCSLGAALPPLLLY